MSLLSPRGVRRIAVLGLLGAIVVMAMLPFIGDTVKGAARWVNLGPFSLQPSEFAKPSLIVFAAWMFAEGQKGQGVPGVSIAFGFYVVTVALLLIQPDIGQTLLITTTFMAVFFMAGVPLRWVAVLGGMFVAGMTAIYLLFPHVQSRVAKFVSPGVEDTHQIDRASEAIRAGGLVGRGVGEGVMKRSVPDLHTDFIYSVGAEEFGLVLSLVMIGLYAFIVFRGMGRAMKLNDPFEQTAAAGLFMLIGLQASINVAVNLNLIPTKGMTLPFISYGGSSMMAMGLTMGFALALTRRRPGAYEPGASLQRPRRLLMP
jgi:cell division protein FtsW